MTVAPSPLDRAILCTLLYGDVFCFPMTAAEIHYYLIGMTATHDAVDAALQTPSEWLEAHIITGEVAGQPCYAVAEQDAEVFAVRGARETASAALWGKAWRYGGWLGALPFVEMVGMTGALAVRNASDPTDDLDYLLVVREGRVWLARLLAVIMVRLMRLWGVTLCPNYVLASSALHQERYDMFMAHEIAQMIPVTGHHVYHQMRDVNAWTQEFLPNANSALYMEPECSPRWLGRAVKWLGERVLGGWLGDRLERWEMQRKLRKFQAQVTGDSHAHLDETHVKGHFYDYGQVTLERFEERLQAYDLSLPPVRVEEHSPAAD